MNSQILFSENDCYFEGEKNPTQTHFVAFKEQKPNLAGYLCARASKVTLLLSLFYMWSVSLAAVLMYKSVLKEKS